MSESVDECDSTIPTNGGDWRELPTEVLMMIFNKLKMEQPTSNSMYFRDRQHLLNARLVHPLWKAAMDTLLQTWSLEAWTIWKGNHPPSEKSPYLFPILHVQKRESRSDGVDNVFGPSISPPTKTVLITNLAKPNLRTSSTEFPKWGHFLTSLTFQNVSLFPDTVKRFLSHMMNLKALTLQDVCFSGGSDALENTSLPPLTHLEHMKIIYIQPEYFDWILEPYKKQLVSFEIETDMPLQWNDESYTNLRRLKIRKPSKDLPSASILAPSLQCLSVGCVYWYDAPNTLQTFLPQFSNSLVELYLDLLITLPLFQSWRGEKEKDELVITSPMRNCIFPLLKTFWMLYPQSRETKVLIKALLGMFPNLETLKFVEFDGNGREKEEDKKTVSDNLREERYWIICPKLKTITVQLGGHTNMPFIVCSPPFSF